MVTTLDEAALLMVTSHTNPFPTNYGDLVENGVRHRTQEPASHKTHTFGSQPPFYLNTNCSNDKSEASSSHAGLYNLGWYGL